MQSHSIPIRRFQKFSAEARRRPEAIGTLMITESPIAIVITALLIIILFDAVPPTRIFFLGVLVFGGLTGLCLWLRHS